MIGLSPKFLREFNCKREWELPRSSFLSQLGKDSCLGTEKYLIDSIGNGVLSEFRNLKKPFGLLKEFLEENVEFQLFAQLCTDKIKDCLHQNHHIPKRGIAQNSDVFEIVSLFDKTITLFTFPPGQINLQDPHHPLRRNGNIGE
jgi:hypothetical protein